MSEIDYALAYQFIYPDDPTVPYQLVFRIDPMNQPGAANPWQGNPTGVLVAKASYPDFPDFGSEHFVSRAGIRFMDAEKAVNAERWPMLSAETVDLRAVVRRVAAAGLT